MPKITFARGLLLAGFVLLIVLFAWEAFSQELSVIEVRRNIPLADKDPVYKDYFINGGASQGLKAKSVVTATRKVQMKDVSGNVIGEIQVPVGTLKIIAVGAKISVARMAQDIPRDDQPMLEQSGVMIGDSIDLKAFVIEAPKKTASLEEKPAPLAAPAAAVVMTAPPAPAQAAAPVQAPLPEKKVASGPSPASVPEVNPPLK